MVSLRARLELAGGCPIREANHRAGGPQGRNWPLRHQYHERRENHEALPKSCRLHDPPPPNQNEGDYMRGATLVPDEPCLFPVRSNVLVRSDVLVDATAIAA